MFHIFTYTYIYLNMTVANWEARMLFYNINELLVLSVVVAWR